MGFWEVLEVASDPVLQVLLISGLGALMASHYFNHLLSPDFRKSLNKIVFIVFTPSLIFSSFANTVSLQDMLSWWFMPLNIALTFLIGGVMGWMIVKVLKPNPKLHGNLGNLPIVIIPAICDEKGGPFGSPDACRSNALSYSSFSLAQIVMKKPNESFLQRLTHILYHILKQLMAPPTIATILGFVFGGITLLRNLIIGQNAPLRLIQHTIQLLGDGTIPCITLLLGGNLTQGMKSWSVKPWVLVGILVSRFVIQPAIGMLIVKMAANFGFLPVDPLFHYVLVMQYAMPPAMNISTMAQLFDVGEEECSVILLWSYGAAAIALTAWSTFLMCLFS
ncbi:protein PIN-LIKES 7-like [Senna tora]|uniref:Protein PIN-LIKES 7-like n=1 Tax=Senna tora TaxID=362788 RepID=A0A834WA42_9FABA|nr:protein PIN-LIKES 7-like [Senna tora]